MNTSNTTPSHCTPACGTLTCGASVCPVAARSVLPDPDDGFDTAAYQAGHDDCLTGAYDDRPGTEWIYLTGSRAVYDADLKRVVHQMTPLRFAELTWRRASPSVAVYGRWFYREYGYDLASYLDGFDDAGAGLPSAVRDPEGYLMAVARLDAYAPLGVLACAPDCELAAID